jgi:simple sugar transport system permease protein
LSKETKEKKVSVLQIRQEGFIQDLIVKYGFIVVTIGLFSWFAITEETFRQPTTLFSMLKFTSVVAIVGLGVTFTMIVGGLDLSVGSVAGLAVTTAAMMMVIYNLTGFASGAMVLLAGALVGLINAVLIVWLKIPDLLATLGMMFIIMGLKLLPVDGQSVSSKMILRDGSVAPGKFTEGFLAIDRFMVGPVPFPVVLWLTLTVLSWFLLTRTKYGRIMYAVGANPEAAKLSGIKVEYYRASAYVISGLFAATGGMILASRIGQGDISAGNSVLLDAVAVALVGTSVLGIGKPNAWGTALGALLVGIVITGLTIKGFPYYAQDISKGLVLVVALIFSFTLSRKKARFVPAT